MLELYVQSHIIELLYWFIFLFFCMIAIRKSLLIGILTKRILAKGKKETQFTGTWLTASMAALTDFN